MERERQHQEHSAAGGGEPVPDPDRDSQREKLRGMLDAADRVLDSIQPLGAEKFLQQHRQRGAQ